MRYIEDENFKYRDELIKQLRAYNLKHTGEKTSSTEYFYAVEGEKLVGSVYTNYFWDWVSIGSMFYENLDVLKKLISEVSNYYQNRAIGIKLYTEVEARVEDFKAIGFHIGGITAGTQRTTRNFYLYNTDFDVKGTSQIEVTVGNEKIEKYNSILLNAVDQFNRGNNIHKMEERKCI